MEGRWRGDRTWALAEPTLDSATSSVMAPQSTIMPWLSVAAQRCQTARAACSCERPSKVSEGQGRREMGGRSHLREL